MNDENDKPKNDDWGMTMPHLRYEEQKNADGLPDEFASEVNQTSRPTANDEWGMTTPNLNIPDDYAPTSDAADFDKTAPNLNVPNNFWEDKSPPPLEPLPADDWEMTAPNANLPPEDRRDDWEANAPRFDPPPKKNDWAMPTPVFRVSEGENIEDIKKTAAFKLSDLQDFDTETMNFKPSASNPPPPESFANTVPNLNLPAAMPPVVPNNFAAPSIVSESAPIIQPVKTAPSSAEKSNSKTPYVVGGLLAMMLFAGVFLVGTYFLFFNKPAAVTTKAEPVKTETTSDSAVSPAPLTTTAPPVQTKDLPKRIVYKGAMLLVAAGEFTMGSDADADDAKPAHQVVLPAFYIDQTEVTNREYRAFCDATGKSYPPDLHFEKGYFTNRPNAPVVGVSFADAKAYADWAGKRLPTEEEWEKAASWDEAAQSKREFPWGDNFQAKNAAYQTSKISDVGKFPGGASPSGALDMAGNVLEWVDAFFQPYPNSATSNPEFGETNRVVRGGHFASKSTDSLKTTKRIYIPPTVASGEDDAQLVAAIIGFRCAVSADAPAIGDILSSQGK
ncbi:MAG: formylglycine-generating enzyme family protein [Acidobacteriota bacterium]|nr:formylglycine-generating enzyme family protein [Acidobacteriota bacterium]